MHTQIASGNILKTMALMAPEPKGISARRGLAAVGLSLTRSIMEVVNPGV